MDDVRVRAISILLSEKYEMYGGKDCVEYILKIKNRNPNYKGRPVGFKNKAKVK